MIVAKWLDFAEQSGYGSVQVKIGPAPMANLLYKDRLIITLATLDETKGCWIPTVDISWTQNAYQHSHRITYSESQLKSRQEAEDFILEVAKAWIDELR